MGKTKKGLSDIVRSKRNSKSKPSQVNPFEVQINRVKHVVVNKRVERWEKGRPGVSRSKAIQKRQDTILNELRQIKKTNVFHDKRIGEKDSSLTAEEKMVRRYALERKAQTNKQDIFNLNEDEVELTHYGQSLAENFKDKPGSDSEDDDLYTDRGNTGRYQFGGFSDGDEASWKDKMQEVIIDSKKLKYERQMEREKNLETTKELDDVWKSVKDKMKPQADKGPNKSTSSFMMLSRSLILERTSGQASDKLKTEEEAAREASDKLKELEAQRLERMRGVVEKKMNHVSADSLSSGFALDKKDRAKVSFADSDQSDDEEEDDDKHESSEEKKDDEDDKESDDEDDDSDDDDSGSDEDNYSDLDEDEGSGEEGSGDESDEDEAPNQKMKSILKKSKIPPVSTNGSPAESELPYVFEAPDSYEELQLLLHGHSPSDKITILSRLRKCYHTSLAAENKAKLQKIHLFVLQYIGDVAQEKDLDSKLIDGLFSHIWDFTQTFSRSAAKFMQGVVMEKQKEYAAVAERRGGRGLFPSLETLLYLRLVEILFPTSDFIHEVTTPTIHFITQMLAESSVRNLKDVTCGLYLSALCLQFIHSSQRYVPEITTFLHGVLYLASCESKAEASQTFQPFRKASRESCQLEIKKKCNTLSSSPLSLSRLVDPSSDENENDANQLRCDLINTCIDLLDECVTVWSKLPCLSLVLKPVDVQLKSLPTHLYPNALKDKIEKLTSRIGEVNQVKFTAMKLESKKPEPLKLFEPLVEENWAGKRKRGGADRDAANRQRMIHVFKRDMRSAVREIRRDHAVIAKHKLEVTMKKDAERKRRVKDIMSGLASQEGDFNALKKQKKSLKS